MHVSKHRIKCHWYTYIWNIKIIHFLFRHSISIRFKNIRISMVAAVLESCHQRHTVGDVQTHILIAMNLRDWWVRNDNFPCIRQNASWRGWRPWQCLSHQLINTFTIKFQRGTTWRLPRRRLTFNRWGDRTAWQSFAFAERFLGPPEQPNNFCISDCMDEILLLLTVCDES